MSDELRSRALRLLTRREHTRAELEKKLSSNADAEEVEALLNNLQEAGLQSDVRFVESYVRSYAARFGAAKLRYNLRSKGVDAELIATHLSAADLGDELERAKALWQRKFALVPSDAREWAKQARFLQGRGFSGDIIRRVLKDIEE